VLKGGLKRMARFKVGDRVERTVESGIIKKGNVCIVTRINVGGKGDYINVEGHTPNFYEGCFKLAEPVEEKMEFDISKVDKKILKQANKEVLEEMDNEVKVKAKAHLKTLYQQYDKLQEENRKITSELKDILEVISSVARK
jgi:hypothetical protein